LSFALLHTTQWQLTDKNNWIDFLKSNFHFNENIQWHCMQLELDLKNYVYFKFNWKQMSMQIGATGIKNLLVTMVL